MNAFAVQGGVVHHTYSAYNRGVETLMGTYQYLDLTPQRVATRTTCRSRRRGGAATTSTGCPDGLVDAVRRPWPVCELASG